MIHVNYDIDKEILHNSNLNGKNIYNMINNIQNVKSCDSCGK